MQQGGIYDYTTTNGISYDLSYSFLNFAINLS